MPHVQLLAYCRYIQLWSVLYIIRIVSISPLSSLIVTSCLHLVTLKINSKRIGILSLDILQILLILIHSKKLFILENLYIVSVYINYLLILEKNPITLYTVELKEDDILYQNENFLQYIRRLSCYIVYLFNKKL